VYVEPLPEIVMQRIKLLRIPQRMDSNGVQQVAFHDALRATGRFTLTDGTDGEIELPEGTEAVKQLREFEAGSVGSLYENVARTTTPRGTSEWYTEHLVAVLKIQKVARAKIERMRQPGYVPPPKTQKASMASVAAGGKKKKMPPKLHTNAVPAAVGNAPGPAQSLRVGKTSSTGAVPPSAVSARPVVGGAAEAPPRKPKADGSKGTSSRRPSPAPGGSARPRAGSTDRGRSAAQVKV
jgi:hypothetical protein